MRTILVTGASDGIGKSIALRLAESGNKLILLGRDSQRLDEVARDCKTKGCEVTTYAFDLCDHAARNETVTDILSKSEVDVLINNAGIWQKMGELNTLSEDKVIEIININLTAQILLTSELYESMKDREDTAILSIVSKSGLIAQKGQSVYTASKYGMKGFIDALREDTKPCPIRIGAIYQSGTATNMFAKAGEEVQKEKFTNPDDLAELVYFMLSHPDKMWLNEAHVVY